MRQDLVEKVSQHIRYAFEELPKGERCRVDLNKAIIVCSYLHDMAGYTELLGIPVFATDLQSCYDYYIAIPDPNSVEMKWLKIHREVTEVY